MQALVPRLCLRAREWTFTCRATRDACGCAQAVRRGWGWCARPHARRGRLAVGARAAVAGHGGVSAVPGLELLFGDDAAEADELDAIIRDVEETAGILTAGNSSLEDKTLPFEDQDGLNGHLDPGGGDQHELIVLLDGQ